MSRLTFAYEADQVRLVSEQFVDMTLAPSHPAEGLEEKSGFAVVLRHDDGHAVYARVTASPFAFDREVFDRDPSRSIRRMENPHPRGTFVVHVPAVEEARQVEFFGHPLHAKAHHLPTRKLATFKLRQMKSL
ncbi:MAG TPA: hypothetical protein VMT20_25425 [Terriglobia bacterium]|nr:hypothetical protein [Terriglobia bacterium]